MELGSFRGDTCFTLSQGMPDYMQQNYQALAIYLAPSPFLEPQKKAVSMKTASQLQLLEGHPVTPCPCFRQADSFSKRTGYLFGQVDSDLLRDSFPVSQSGAGRRFAMAGCCFFGGAVLEPGCGHEGRGCRRR